MKRLLIVATGVQRREDRRAENSRFAQGLFSLQFGNHGKMPGGAIKWRKVQVREL
jgi:hypothetical protein